MFNVVTAAVGWTKRAAVFTGAGLAVLGGASAAVASPGCDAINQIWGGGVTLSNGVELSDPWPLPPMKAGDEVIYVASTTGSTNTHVPSGGGFALYRNQGVAWPDDILIEEFGSQGNELAANGRYVLPDDNAGFIVYGWSGSGGATLRATVTCTPAAAAPTITALTPGSGPTAGGTSVAITGADFTGATAVTFGGVSATSFTVNSATRITATTPAGPAGSVPVSVVTGLGTSAPATAATYTYVQPPAAPTLIANPPTISNSASARFDFSVPPGADLHASLDGGAYTPTANPLTFTGLADGTHVLRYKAVASGVESAVTSYNWTIDTTPPSAPTIIAPTAGATVADRPTLSGTTEIGATVQVFIDGALTGVTMANGAGTWSFTPTLPLPVGGHVLTVQVVDGVGNVSPLSSPVAFTVQNAAPPTAGPVAVVAPFGQATTFDLTPWIGGDYDSVQLVTAPIYGSLTLMWNGVGTYTPSNGYSGPDSFTYTATGPGGVSAPGVVTVTVSAPTAPVASPAAFAVPFDSPGHAIDLSTSITGVHTSLAVALQPAHGVVSVSGDVVTYTPVTGYHGADSFTYTATGPGGISGQATVSLTIAAPTAPDIDPPAPVVVQPGPDGSSTIALPPAVSGVVTGYRVDSAPAHGQVVVQAPSGGGGWSLAYTPAPGFMGEDTIAVVAQGPGGESAPATMTFRVLGQAPDLQGVSQGGQAVVFAPTTGLTGGPFQGLVITRQPTSGTAQVDGLKIIYTPDASAAPAARRMAMRAAAAPAAATPMSLDYAVVLPFGQSLPGTIEVQAVTIPTLTPLTATTLAGRPVTVSLTDKATGGPFVGATVVGVSNQAGTATLTEGGVAGNRTYDVTFTPEGDFTGTASVTYTLSNAGGPATGVLTVTVEARSDPSLDQEVRGLVSAQADTARRFARSQADNFHRRLEQVRRGGGAGVSNQMRLNLGDGGLNQDPREALRQQLGQSPSDDGFDRLPSAQTPAVDAATRQANAGQPAKGGLGVWTAGAIDWGRRDAQGQRDYRFSTSGVSAGVDMAVSDRWVAGVGLGYGHDRTKVGDNGTLSEADSYVGAAYGSWRATDDLIVDGVLGYGSLSFDSRRWSADAGEFAFGERSGSVLFGSASVALERSAAGLAWAPYARLQFGRVDLDGFTENGAGVFALKYDAMTVDTLAAALGASLDWTLQRRSGVLTPGLRIEWRHEFEGADDQAVSYADWLASPDYMVGLERWARDSLSLSMGVQWRAISGWSYGVDYQGQLGEDLSSHGLKLRLMKTF